MLLADEAVRARDLFGVRGDRFSRSVPSLEPIDDAGPPGCASGADCWLIMGLTTGRYGGTICLYGGGDSAGRAQPSQGFYGPKGAGGDGS